MARSLNAQSAIVMMDGTVIECNETPRALVNLVYGNDSTGDYFKPYELVQANGETIYINFRHVAYIRKNP